MENRYAIVLEKMRAFSFVNICQFALERTLESSVNHHLLFEYSTRKLRVNAGVHSSASFLHLVGIPTDGQTVVDGPTDGQTGVDGPEDGQTRRIFPIHVAKENTKSFWTVHSK
ncbi:hypothetical protein CEXT_628641 [Caerostris extrusa]|uniref:Uncharacterized protein n=1 Tax=Caerostris extrusa TaxID=172846 RepID=A0AAV4U6Q0_CAEEX|nr:hypothetical protein CEXT_628641 [Caerostris extrusa]